MSHHPGDHRWYMHAPPSWPTISVIEPKSETYEAFADRREREKDAPRVPFGFARALEKPTP